MKFISTRGGQDVTFRKALLEGLAQDGGLYLPESLPVFSQEEFLALRNLSFAELASKIFDRLIGSEFTAEELRADCIEAFSFEPVLQWVDEKLYILELFHGPTCAFKDYGARFLAALTRRVLREEGGRLLVLVATSGDTGSAVAQAFFDPNPVPSVRVAVLYPKGRVSEIQERQMVTLGHNVIALEVEGSFDDCQRLTKEAFQDPELRAAGPISSANSINIARLLPQSIYYIWAALQLWEKAPVVFSVPSGNLGNLVAGVLAQRMGMPVEHFVAPTNVNRALGQFLETGRYEPRTSIQTVSNAMDVGSPSNFERLSALFDGSVERMRAVISSPSFSDRETAVMASNFCEQIGYVADPHTAIGILGARERQTDRCSVVLSTAHPAKFGAFVKEHCGEVPVPPQIDNLFRKEKRSIVIPPRYDALKEILLSLL